MPTYFPCPNAQCSYQFDADILPPAAMVTCPLCRTRFPYRANRPVAAGAAGGEPADEVRPAGPRVVNLRDVPKSNVWITVISVGAFCVVLIGIIIGLNSRGGNLGSSPTDAADERLNLKVEPFPAGWEEDANVRKPMDANVLGRRRSNPDGYVAVVARDWGDVQPRTSELDELMRGRLRQGVSTLEVQPIEGETWAGQPALAVRFTGSVNDEQVRGEAYVMGYKGVGYAFFAWAGESNWAGLRDELVALREKVRPAGFREKWTPKRANTVMYPSDDGSYQVEDVDGAWLKGKPDDQWGPKEAKYVVEPDDLKGLDPKAVMAFRAEYQIRERGDAKRQPAQAYAVVVELDKGGDPLDMAKAHVVERIKKDYATDKVPEVELKPMTRSPSGVPLPTGGPAIARLLFVDKLDKDNQVMWVISAIRVGGKTVAVESHVPEKHASHVDEWMVHFAGSLKAR
jgi:hypothetical protein